MAKKIKKGKPLQELVKGSLDFTIRAIQDAFRLQFPYIENGVNYYIEESFADFVIIKSYNDGSPLGVDEFYKADYTKEGDGYVFATPKEWVLVELGYQAQTASITESKKKQGRSIEERIGGNQVELLEAKDEKKNTRRIRINNLMVADEINGNGRLYPANVIEAMVADWRPYLRESRGQGRLMITGEVEHPSDKGKKRAEFLETVVTWDTLDWDGKRLNIEGNLILTDKGRNVEILMEAGVNPGGSIRGRGESKIKKMSGKSVEEVLWVSLNAADLVGDPSFANSAGLQESKKSSMEDEMNIEELKKLLADHPELFGKGMTEAKLTEMGENTLSKLEETLRTKLGLDAGADIGESLDGMLDKVKAFEESQRKAAVADAINEATKDLPFGEKLNEQFTTALLEAAPQTPEAVKTLVEAKRKEYGALAAAGVLAGMGWNEETHSVEVIGSVLESQTGTPDFARGAFELTEALHRRELTVRRNLQEGVSPAEILTRRALARFDKNNRSQLMAEARRFEEAEQTSDLNLPYSVSRAVIEEVMPTLVALNIFDVGLMTGSDERVFYEEFEGETGYTVAVTDESSVAPAVGSWKSLDYKFMTPDSVVITTDPAGTAYAEGTDYIVDYINGRYQILAAGSITAADDLLVDYSYTAIAKGEMAEIERGKLTMSSKILTAGAVRLADQISSEAMVFSQTQLGWNAVARTMQSLIRQTRTKIDGGLMYLARAAVMGVASNSGGTWTNGTDSYDLLAKYIGYAKVKVENRYYSADFILASKSNADEFGNWDGFKTTGFPNALLNSAGFAGMAKGLPIFSSTEFPDNLMLVGSKSLVIHRILRAMLVKGPFQSRSTGGKLIGAEEYYTEEYNASDAPVFNKGAYVKIA